jgi:hypothetical protein
MADGLDVTAGASVFHVRFGLGRVDAVEPEGVIVVDFAGEGRKRVLPSFLQTVRAGALRGDTWARRQQPTGPVVKADISAGAFSWIDPALIPPRQFLYGRHYARKFMSATVSPGGVGKSSLVIVEALAMVSGRPLLGVAPGPPLRVWIWNGEDPLEEMQRRVMAAALRYGLQPPDIGDRLFVDSGREKEIKLATQDRSGVKIASPLIEAMKGTICANDIDVVIVDPFVSSHLVSENDNGAIDAVAKAWAKIADEMNVSVELVHHSRKTNGAEVTVEDARGASALIAASRAARVLNVMTQDEAARAGVEHSRFRHFRVDDGKASMSPPAEKSEWFFLASHALGNGGLEGGDSVGVVETWAWPQPMDGVSVDDLRKAQAAVRGGRWRHHHTAAQWVGIPIAEALDLDLSNKAHKAKVRRLLDIWTANGMFVVVDGLDERRKEVTFVEVGEDASD